jgi:rubredoxin
MLPKARVHVKCGPGKPGVDRRCRSAHVLCMKAYMCLICGYLYDEERGDPESGIDPGTRWDDVPLSWRCPDCGAGKEDFEMVEV